MGNKSLNELNSITFIKIFRFSRLVYFYAVFMNRPL